MRFYLKISAVIYLCICAVTPAIAEIPKGVWSSADGEAKLKVSACGDNICAEIIGLKEPLNKETGKAVTDENNPDVLKRTRPVIGISLFSSMKPTGDNIWKGKVYNSDDGKSYDATVTFNGETIAVKGCALGGLICQEERWTK